MKEHRDKLGRAISLSEIHRCSTDRIFVDERPWQVIKDIGRFCSKTTRESVEMDM